MTKKKQCKPHFDAWYSIRSYLKEKNKAEFTTANTENKKQQTEKQKNKKNSSHFYQLYIDIDKYVLEHLSFITTKTSIARSSFSICSDTSSKTTNDKHFSIRYP